MLIDEEALRREAALILLSLIVLETAAITGTALSQQATSPPLQLCKPVLVDLAPLGLNPWRAQAYLVYGNSLVPLPSFPAPSGGIVYGPFMPVGFSANSSPVDHVRGRIVAKKVAVKEDIGALEPRLLRESLNNTRLLVILPCQEAPYSTRISISPEKAIELLDSRIVAVYSVYNYTLVITEKAWPRFPLFPYADAQVVELYSASSDGAPLRPVIEYAINRSILAQGKALFAKLVKVINHAGEEKRLGKTGYFLWDIIPWQSMGGDSYAYLAPIGFGTEVRRSHWSWHGVFKIPPRTTRYEVYAFIAARKSTTIHVVAMLDGHKVIELNHSLRRGEVLVLGTIASREPERPGNYFIAGSPVSYSIALTSASEPDLVVRIVPVARSYAGPGAPENLVYTWRHYIAGIEQGNNPPIRILPRHHNTFVLRAPLAFLENTATLTVTVYGSQGASKPAHVIVGLNGLELCNGYTAKTLYRGMYRQVYKCMAASEALSSYIVDALRSGTPLFLDIYIDAEKGQWFMDSGAVLSAKRRMRPSIGAAASTDVRYYGLAIANPVTATYYAISKTRATVMLADAELYAETHLLYKGRIEPLKTRYYLAISMPYYHVETQPHGSIDAYPIALGIDGLTISNATKLRAPVGNAIALTQWDGSSARSTLSRYALWVSYILSIFSTTLCDSPATLLGAFSAIGGAPAIYYREESTSFNASCVAPYEAYAEATLVTGTKPRESLELVVSTQILPVNPWKSEVFAKTLCRIELGTMHRWALAQTSLTCHGAEIPVPAR